MFSQLEVFQFLFAVLSRQPLFNLIKKNRPLFLSARGILNVIWFRFLLQFHLFDVSGLCAAHTGSRRVQFRLFKSTYSFQYRFLRWWRRQTMRLRIIYNDVTTEQKVDGNTNKILKYSMRNCQKQSAFSLFYFLTLFIFVFIVAIASTAVSFCFPRAQHQP